MAFGAPGFGIVAICLGILCAGVAIVAGCAATRLRAIREIVAAFGFSALVITHGLRTWLHFLFGWMMDGKKRPEVGIFIVPLLQCLGATITLANACRAALT